jgi:hypothetical protein
MRVWPAVVFGALACHAGAPSPVALAAGTYRLSEAQSFNRPGIVSGEGTALRSATIHLAADHTLDAKAVVASTDSGTVMDTAQVLGHWYIASDSLHVTYEWTVPRLSPIIHWDSLAGAIGANGFVLPRFALVESGNDLGLSFERD